MAASLREKKKQKTSFLPKTDKNSNKKVIAEMSKESQLSVFKNKFSRNSGNGSQKS